MAHTDEKTFLQSLVARAEPDTAWKKLSNDHTEHREHNRLAFQVATRVLIYLKEEGKTKAWLADRMSVSAQHVGKILKGGQNMTLETVGKLAEATGLTLLEVPAAESPTRAPLRKNIHDGLIDNPTEVYGGQSATHHDPCLELA
jgi:transcriptional regulator with XRE-family HTH domain